MQIHSVGQRVNDEMIEALKKQHVPTKAVRPFTDPIREFHRASEVEGLVRHWLTIPVAERKKHVETFRFIPRYAGEANRGIEPENAQAFENRCMERWRALCVIIQEESRAAASPKLGEASPEVAIRALKLLFPDYDWPKPLPQKS